MALRRLLVVLALSFVATPLLAAPAKKKPATPVAPAKDTGSGSDAGAGSAVEPIEEPPSATEMNGTEDNPDAPHALTTEEAAKPAVVVAAPAKKTYPIELALRPITLTQNLTEISIAPHIQVKDPEAMSDAIHARYGITDKIQVGVTYLYVGGYDRSFVVAGPSSSFGFHSGKAFGFDVSYEIFDWLAVQLGVPFYVSPFALGLQIGAPLKFHITDKFALGGMDDLLNIQLHNFAPSFYQEVDNAVAAQNLTVNTPNSHGRLRLSVYGIYNYTSQFAIVGRLGLDENLGNGTGTDVPGGTQGGGSAVFIKAGFLYSPKQYLDVGLQLGFDDLSKSGSFGPQAFLSVRI
jgi:hypothetical protein